MRLVSPVSFVLLVGSLSACADKGDEGMFILNNSTPPITGACTLTGDPAQPSTATGEISYLAKMGGTGYVLTPLIESRITANMGDEALRTIHLEGANITATVANTNTSTSYSVLFSGSVAPNGGATNVVFEALPGGRISDLHTDDTQNTEVILAIGVYGSLGGGRIDAEPFQYPVTVVGQNKGIIFGTTIYCTDMVGGRTGNSCNPLQDGTVDCCESKATGAVYCPAVPGTP